MRRIKNPLAHLSPQQLMADVERFAHEHGLADELPLLRKGALVARDPDRFEHLPVGEQLDEAEREALRVEARHRWRVPRLLYLTIITCSVGAAVQGWDQEGSNGANLSFPEEFGIAGNDDRSVWLLGLINAAPYLASAYVTLPLPAFLLPPPPSSLPLRLVCYNGELDEEGDGEGGDLVRDVSLN